MSDTFSQTIIGLRITKKHIRETNTYEHKLCKCEGNSSKFNYCPQCGLLNEYGTYEKIEYIDNYKKVPSDTSLGILTVNEKGYRVRKYSEDRHYKFNKFQFIVLCEFDDECPIPFEQLYKLKKQMKIDLKTINLWKESKFGIYNII